MPPPELRAPQREGAMTPKYIRGSARTAKNDHFPLSRSSTIKIYNAPVAQMDRAPSC